MAVPFSWVRAFVVQTHRRGKQNVDIVHPTPLQPDVIEHLNIVLTSSTDGAVDRQEFLFRFPTSEGMLYAYVAVRWLPDPTSPGEHLQRSLILVSAWPCLVLFCRIVHDISGAYFSVGSSEGDKLITSVADEIAAWPVPRELIPLQETTLTLTLRGQPLDPVPLAFTDTQIAGQLVCMMSVSSALRSCISHLSCLWELVLLAQPILVVGPDAPTVARGVLAVISSISPLSYAGDFRPYVDVTNPAAVASLNLKRPCVVGVVGAGAVSNLPAPEAGWHVLWLVPPMGLSSGYAPALPSEPLPPTGGADESSESLLLRGHLIRMVADFCAPLDAFAWQQLQGAQKSTTAFRASVPPLFDSNAALEWLEQTHLPRSHPTASKRVLLYRRFFSSPTFGLWRLNRQAEDGTSLLATQMAAIRKLPLIALLGELELVDVIIRASDAARQAGVGPVRAALEAEVASMRASLPIDLQQSLPAAILGTYSPITPPASANTSPMSGKALQLSPTPSTTGYVPMTSTAALVSPAPSPTPSATASPVVSNASAPNSAKHILDAPRPPSVSLKPEDVSAADRKDTVSEAPQSSLLLSKEQLKQVVSHFNSKPQAAIDAITTAGHWKGEPEEIAAFLWASQGLSPAKVGEFLSEYKPHNIAALRAYAALFQFAGKSFADALREFLSRFRLPGEAQKIDRIMEAFAGRFHNCNPQSFPSADTAYVLAFSTIMLNTDAHNPQVKKKMTKREFVSNNRGIADGKDLPQAFLEALYDSIVKTAIQLNADGLFSQAERKGWLLKQGANSVGSWQKRWFILAANCLYYFTKPEDKDPRVIIPLEGLAVRTTNEWPGHPCFEIYHPQAGQKIKSVKLGAPGGTSEGQHDKFVFEAESAADLEGWIKGIQAHVVHSPGLHLLLEKKKEISTRTQSPREAGAVPPPAAATLSAPPTESKLSSSTWSWVSNLYWYGSSAGPASVPASVSASTSTTPRSDRAETAPPTNGRTSTGGTVTPTEGSATSVAVAPAPAPTPPPVAAEIVPAPAEPAPATEGASVGADK